MRVLVPIAAFAVAVAVAGCGGEQQSAPAPTATTTPPPRAAGTTPSGLDPIVGESLDGEPVTLEDFRGRYLFVNVWSSW